MAGVPPVENGLLEDVARFPAGIAIARILPLQRIKALHRDRPCFWSSGHIMGHMQYILSAAASQHAQEAPPHAEPRRLGVLLTR